MMASSLLPDEAKSLRIEFGFDGVGSTLQTPATFIYRGADPNRSGTTRWIPRLRHLSGYATDYPASCIQRLDATQQQHVGHTFH